jgi:hypothetical protein
MLIYRRNSPGRLLDRGRDGTQCLGPFLAVPGQLPQMPSLARVSCQPIPAHMYTFLLS